MAMLGVFSFLLIAAIFTFFYFMKEQRSYMTTAKIYSACENFAISTDPKEFLPLKNKLLELENIFLNETERKKQARALWKNISLGKNEYIPEISIFTLSYDMYDINQCVEKEGRRQDERLVDYGALSKESCSEKDLQRMQKNKISIWVDEDLKAIREYISKIEG